jgi:putative oxidoreductase
VLETSSGVRAERKIDWLGWALRIPLALIFLFVGVIKFPANPGSPWVRIFDLIGFGQWFRYFTAVVETLAGVLLLVPRATPIAVFLVAASMIGAILVHIFVVGLGPPTVIVTLLLLAGLAIGWRHLSRE